MALVIDYIIYFCAAHHNINVHIVHVSGIYNDRANSLSYVLSDGTLASEADLTSDSISVWPIQFFMDALCNATIMVYLHLPIVHINQD